MQRRLKDTDKLSPTPRGDDASYAFEPIGQCSNSCTGRVFANRELISSMRTIAFIAHKGNLGLATRNSEMLSRLRSYGKILEVYHHSKLDLARGIRLQRLRRTLWPPFAIGVDLMIGAIVAQLSDFKPRPDFVHAETSPMGYAALTYSEESGVPYVLDLHGLWSAEHLGRIEAMSATVNRRRASAIQYMERIEREAARRADRLLVVSEAMKAHVVMNWGVSASRVQVIPNGGFKSSGRATF